MVGMARGAVIAAAAVALAVAASAGAKGSVVADVCGAWDCVTLRDRATSPLTSWLYTPFVELAAPRPARYYSIRLHFSPDIRATLLYVPSRRVARVWQSLGVPSSRPGIGPYWRAVPRGSVPALNRIVDRLQASAVPARWPRNEELPPACRASVANGRVPPGAPKSLFGNGRLATAAYRVIFADGRTVNADGTISEKFPWFGAPGVRGDLRITGARLDRRGGGLRAGINEGAVPGAPRGSRFWSSGITFPTGGCWRILARAGSDRLAVVVNVEQPPPRTTRAAAPPRVPCDDVIGYARSATAGGYRRVLGVVSVPGAHLPEIEDTPSRPWRYWRKAGLVVRAGREVVTVSVPPAWRKRAAISWGNSTGIVSSLRLGGCLEPSGAWLAFAGGFVLRTPSACLPLTFKVGARTATVRFGLGTTCPGA